MNVDASIISTMTFDAFVPADPLSCFNTDLHEVETRNWAVPGETLYIFVKTSPSVLQLDAITFSPYVTRKSVRSRRSTLMSPITPTVCADYIDLTGTTTHHSFPTMKPFRLESGHGIYPMSVKIPLDLAVPFYVDVFIPRSKTPIARVEMRTVLPFTVTWELRSSTVSLVAQFATSVSLKGCPINSIELENTNVAFLTKPSNIEGDFESNIEIVKPAKVSATMKDDDTISSVFIMRPLTEAGASLLANNLLEFMVDWSYKNMRWTNHYMVEVSNQCLGYALLLPPVSTEVMKRVTVPMRVTNMRSEKKRIDLVFEGGPIQPTVQRIRLPELRIGDSCTIDISLLPLVVGCHMFNFWAECEDGQKVAPLFPTYMRVTEAQQC